jgi:hypothetical protein
MSLRKERNDTYRLILENKFVEKTLRAESLELNQDIDLRMTTSGFNSDFWSDKAMTITGGGNTLEYRHKTQHRFVDMRTRNTKEGKIRKKNYPIHNRVIYGHLNNIAKELMYGFTDSAIEGLKKLEN